MRWAILLLAAAGARAQYLDMLVRPALPEAERRSMMYAFVNRNLPEIPAPADRQTWERRRDVDRSRLGFTGESGGGNTTYWISALDERVRLSVPVASVTSFDYWIRNDRNWDWHQRPPGIRAVADIWTLLAMVAPRPPGFNYREAAGTTSPVVCGKGKSSYGRVKRVHRLAWALHESC